jgi:hypothetical protein
VLVNTVTFEPIRVFSLVAATYFLLCWPLSLLAERLGARMDARRSSGIGDIFHRRVTPRRVVVRGREAQQGQGAALDPLKAEL